MITSKRKIGNRGEDIACDYLRKNGYRIIERNYYAGHHEIDIICENEKYLVFAEVKMRADNALVKKYGRPASAVDKRKRMNIIAAAKQYVKEHKTDKFLRLDVIEVFDGRGYSKDEPFRVNHMKGAFGANG